MKLAIGGLVTIFLLVCGLLFWVVKMDSDFSKSCIEQGGHTVNVYKGMICLTPDGRVISSE